MGFKEFFEKIVNFFKWVLCIPQPNPVSEEEQPSKAKQTQAELILRLSEPHQEQADSVEVEPSPILVRRMDLKLASYVAEEKKISVKKKKFEESLDPLIENYSKVVSDSSIKSNWKRVKEDPYQYSLQSKLDEAFRRHPEHRGHLKLIQSLYNEFMEQAKKLHKAILRKDTYLQDKEMEEQKTKYAATPRKKIITDPEELKRLAAEKKEREEARREEQERKRNELRDQMEDMKVAHSKAYADHVYSSLHNGEKYSDWNRPTTRPRRQLDNHADITFRDNTRKL